MQLSAPQKTTWIVALVLGIVGVIASLITIPILTALSTWLIALGWLILVLATYLKGL